MSSLSSFRLLSWLICTSGFSFSSLYVSIFSSLLFGIYPSVLIVVDITDISPTHNFCSLQIRLYLSRFRRKETFPWEAIILKDINGLIFSYFYLLVWHIFKKLFDQLKHYALWANIKYYNKVQKQFNNTQQI